MSLNLYSKKRNFEKTSEPKAQKNLNDQSRFVIQFHKSRITHYDFRLEYNGVLLSWAVPKGLPESEKQKRLAVHVEDHPTDYINFSGTIPKGEYGAGTVQIYDSGHYVKLSNFKDGLKNGKLKFYLLGQKCVGVWTLVKKDDKNWFIVKCKNEHILHPEITSKLPLKNVDVKLAKLADIIPTGKDWLFEIKYDGYRIVSFIENGKVKLISRNGQDYTNKFDNITSALKENFNNQTLILDGEVVVLDKNGKSNFSDLQTSIKSKNNNFSYVIFDILAYFNQILCNFSILERKTILRELLKNCNHNLIYSEHVIGNGKECFNLAKSKNLEGVIAKNIHSKYNGNRDEDWQKIKCYKCQEFVICGYTKSDENQILSSILVGYYNNKKLIFVGKVGTGFSLKTKQELQKKFKPLITTKKLIDYKYGDAIFLKPKLVAEIQYAELTKQNLLRQPSFIALRDDKDPKDVFLEVTT